MRNLNLFLLIATVLITFTACNDHDDDYVNVGMGTVQKMDGMYSINFDGADTYQLPDSTLLAYARLNKPGQRVIAMFNIIGDERRSNQIVLRNIYRVLTKDFAAKPTNEEANKQLGNDVVNILQAWKSNGHLNVKFVMPTDNFPTYPHLINAFNTGEKDADGDIILEFRHNLNGTRPVFWSSYSYVSFPLKEPKADKMGYKIRYKYSENETRIIKVADKGSERVSANALEVLCE